MFELGNYHWIIIFLLHIQFKHSDNLSEIMFKNESNVWMNKLLLA